MRADGGTGECWREAVSGAVAAAAAACRAASSEALECCSEPTTPGGGTTLRPLWRHLEAEKKVFNYRVGTMCVQEFRIFLS